MLVSAQACSMCRAPPQQRLGSACCKGLRSMPGALDRDDMQGLIARGYNGHANSTFLLLRFRSSAVADAKRWLATLTVKDATSAGADTHGNADDIYINIAFSYGGLQRLHCPTAILSGF